jgi:hypothetical protein
MHADFSIGCECLTGAGTWRCTDVGTRVIVAIRINAHPDDPNWYYGPLYAVAASAFDEYAQQGYTPLSFPDQPTEP